MIGFLCSTYCDTAGKIFADSEKMYNVKSHPYPSFNEIFRPANVRADISSNAVPPYVYCVTFIAKTNVHPNIEDMIEGDV